MSDKIETVAEQETELNQKGEFHFEYSPWKVKVNSKGLTPDEFGKMLKQAVGWRQSLFWLIIMMLVIGILLRYNFP
jgi:membrane protein YqaA with SNARE-associated domain